MILNCLSPTGNKLGWNRSLEPGTGDCKGLDGEKETETESQKGGYAFCPETILHFACSNDSSGWGDTFPERMGLQFGSTPRLRAIAITQ